MTGKLTNNEKEERRHLKKYNYTKLFRHEDKVWCIGKKDFHIRPYNLKKGQLVFTAINLTKNMVTRLVKKLTAFTHKYDTADDAVKVVFKIEVLDKICKTLKFRKKRNISKQNKEALLRNLKSKTNIEENTNEYKGKN